LPMSETDKRHMHEDVDYIIRLRETKERRFTQRSFTDDYDKMVEIIYGMARLINPRSIRDEDLRRLYPSLENVTLGMIKDNLDHLIQNSKSENKEDLAKFCCIAGCMIDPKHNRCICRYP